MPGIRSVFVKFNLRLITNFDKFKSNIIDSRLVDQGFEYYFIPCSDIKDNASCTLTFVDFETMTSFTV